MKKMKFEPGMVLKYKTVPGEFDYLGLGGEENVVSELLIILDITPYMWNGKPTKKFLCYHVQNCQLRTIGVDTLNLYYQPFVSSRDGRKENEA